MNAATNAKPTLRRDDARPFATTVHRDAKRPCIVAVLPGVDLARAAWLATSTEMTLTEDEYAETLSGVAVTERVPHLPGECHRDYAARAASAVMAAYVFGWP